MGALENAKNLRREELIEYINRAELREYGVSGGYIKDLFEKAVLESHEENCPLKLVAALDNSDTSGALLGVLKLEGGKFFEGMEIAALALGNPEKILHLPEYADTIESELVEAAGRHGVTIVTGPVDKRSYKGASIHHIVTMITLTDCLEGNTKQPLYVSINGGELKKIAPEIKISDLVETAGAKALKLGYRLRPVADAELTVKEAGITNGEVNVLTEKDCIIQEAGKWLSRSQNLCCGKCVFCREGLTQMEVMYKDVMTGKGKAEYLPLIKEIGEAMRFSTFCSLGQESAEIAISSIEYFEDEYEQHIKNKNCPAKICTAFSRIYIDPDKCNGCMECMDACPADCIEGKSGYIHIIDELDCIRCNKCFDSCPENAVILTASRIPKLPDRLVKCGKFRKY
jgi:fumarate reductase flavoprotein subunit/NADH-quinone oxidoreductase subunit F